MSTNVVDRAVEKLSTEDKSARPSPERITLSKSAIKQLTWPAKGKRRIWDTVQPGLYVSLPASGIAVAYFRYRRNKTQRDYRIGRLDRLNFKVIREEAKKIAAKAELGRDPQEERNKDKQLQLDAKREAASCKLNTLGNFYYNYYIDHANAHLKNAKICLRSIEQNFSQWFDWPMEDITVAMLSQWRNQQMNTPIITGKGDNRTERKRRAGGVNRPVAYLRAVLSVAYEEVEILDHHPLAKLKPLKEPKSPRKRFLKEDEYVRLSNTLRGREDYLPVFIELGLHTGLRMTEMLTLTWDNVDFDERTLVVESQYAKSKRMRTVPLNDTIMTMLREWKFRTQRFGPWVFTNPETSHHYISIKRTWDSAMKKAGIKDFTRQDLRRTFGSWLAERGESIYVIKNLLGHSTVQVTESHYAYLQDASQRNAVDRLAHHS